MERILAGVEAHDNVGQDRDDRTLLLLRMMGSSAMRLLARSLP